MKARLEHLTVKLDADCFITRSHEILEEAKRNPASLNKAKGKAICLLAQFEEFLKSIGLEC